MKWGALVMAVRKIRKNGDEVLRSISKEVDLINDRILTLLDDMAQTMYESNGVGIAAPQVGVLRRVIIADDGQGKLELINPVITSSDGHQKSIEGCLSVPDVYGEIDRPYRITVNAADRKGKSFSLKAEGFLAIILSHEIDHLNGVLFIDKANKLISAEEAAEYRMN